MELKVMKTACPRDCFGGCTMNVSVEDGKIIKVQGAKGNRATDGVLCVKGMSYKDYVYSPNRVQYPKVRVGKRGSNEFKRVSWEFAIDAICSKLNTVKEKLGPKGLMVYTSGGCMGMMEDYYKGFFRQYGGYSTKKGNLCNSAGVEAVKLTYGEAKHNAPWDLENAGLIILWGKNPSNTNVHEMRYINNAISRGSKFITIDPVKNASSLKSDLHISTNPGTDMALALCVMNLLIQRGSVDLDFIDNNTHGFDALREHASKYSLKEVSSLCGVSESQILSVVELIENSKPLTLVCGMGIQRYKNGGQTVRAISMIPALTGDVGKKGGGFRFSNKQWPSLSWPFLPQDNFSVREDYGASMLAEALENYNDPKINMLWIERANPLVMHPDISRLKSALDELDFIVVIDQFMTDTAKYADVVLPAQSFFEYSDIFTSYWSPYISLCQKIIEPYYESKNESQIYRLLGQRMGYDMGYLPEYNDDTINTMLKKSGIHIDVEALKEGPYMEDSMEIAFADGKFNTPSGKIELYSDTVVKKWGQSPMPEFDSAQGGNDDKIYPLRFLSIHPRERTHSQFADIESINSGRPLVYMNSEDAIKRGLSDGDSVTVFNGRGRINVYASITDNVKAGVVNVFEGLSESTGASVNVLVAQDISDIGWGATYYDCFVDVKKCDI